METVKQKKARSMRYKKPALAMLTYEYLYDELYEISGECDEIRYFINDDDDTLLYALDGDEEEEYEFRMMFSDLSAKCERLADELNDSYAREYFDDFFTGILGDKYSVVVYDGYEEDYFGLSGYERHLAHTDSGKRLMRRSKEELLSIAGQCFGIALCMLDIRHKYDYLKSAFDILRDENTSVLMMVRAIDE